MKTLLTLPAAVLACYFSVAQNSPGGPSSHPSSQPTSQPSGQPTGQPASPPSSQPQGPPPSPPPSQPLSHEDSLVLAEANVHTQSPIQPELAVIPDSVAKPQPRVLSFSAVIAAVLEDFPYNLRNITGELVLAQGEFENYASLVALSDEGNCIVTRYHSVDDTTASWQAKMFTADEFSKAEKVYHDLYKKLRGCSMKLVDGSVIYLNGVYEPAKEEAAFTTSTLRLETGDWRYKDVKIELEMVYLLTDWSININIISKKRDDEVGGGHVGALMQ